jgi:hypothetical protein
MVEATSRIAPHHLDQLRRSCAEAITPGDAGYDDGRRLWNAIHDRRPALIARPATAEEVATAIRFAREHDLEITVRSGGHSAAGFSGGRIEVLPDDHISHVSTVPRRSSTLVSEGLMAVIRVHRLAVANVARCRDGALSLCTFGLP